MNAQSPSTALTNVQPAHPNVAALAAGSVMAIVPQTFDDVYRFAQVLSRSGLVPYGMDTPEKVSVAILTGLEIGVKPMQAVQGIAVINGVPRIWGDLALAVVRGSGQLEKFSETLVGSPPADWPNPKAEERGFKAVCVVKRRGEDEVVREYSIGDAVVAKLWNKSGPKGPTPWVTNPKRMLAMRARAFALRDAFTDVLKGMPIAEEMVGDEVEDANFRPAPDRGPPPPPPALEPEEATIISETAAEASPPKAAQDAGSEASNPAGGDPASAGEPEIDPEAELANLSDMLAMAPTEDAVLEGYQHLDIEAVLSGFEGDFIARAQGIRDGNLARVAKLVQAAEPEASPSGEAAPPPPPADGDDGLAPSAPSAEEPDVSTPEAYETTLKAKLAAAGNVEEYEVVRAWWGTTRAHRQDVLGIKDHADIARLQGHFGARKAELGI